MERERKMSSFTLKIVTPETLMFEGEAEKLIVRTVTGDLGILPGHMDIVAPLGKGRALVVTEGQRKTAYCEGGLLSVTKGEATLVATTFDWK